MEFINGEHSVEEVKVRCGPRHETIDFPPSNYNIICTNITTAVDACIQHKQKGCLLTFDRPLHWFVTLLSSLPLIIGESSRHLSNQVEIKAPGKGIGDLKNRLVADVKFIQKRNLFLYIVDSRRSKK